MQTLEQPSLVAVQAGRAVPAGHATQKLIGLSTTSAVYIHPLTVSQSEGPLPGPSAQVATPVHGLPVSKVHAGVDELPVQLKPVSVHPKAQLPVDVDAQSSMTAPQIAGVMTPVMLPTAGPVTAAQA